MKRIALSIVLVLSSAVVANAQVVVWEATGTLIVVETSGGFIDEFPAAAVGSEFTLLIEFDTTAPVSDINSESDFGGGVVIGNRYRYFDALLAISLFVDGVPLVRELDGFKTIDIWDNFGFPGSPTNSACFEPGVACDGFVTFTGLTSSQPGGFAQIVLSMRGSEFLDIYTGIGLPVTPSPVLTSLSTRLFQLVDQTDIIIGEVNSLTRVASPGELLVELAETVEATGPGGSFKSKIDTAQAYLEVSDIDSACGILKAFVNQVSAQSGKKLTDAQAAEFTSDANAIREAIGC